MTSSDVNKFNVHACCTEANVKARESTANKQFKDAVDMIKRFLVTTGQLARSLGPFLVSPYVLGIFEEKYARQEANLAAISNETVRLPGHCWSHMFEVIQRLENERNAINCNVVMALLYSPYLSSEIVFRSGSVWWRRDCSIYDWRNKRDSPAVSSNVVRI